MAILPCRCQRKAVRIGENGESLSEFVQEGNIHFCRGHAFLPVFALRQCVPVGPDDCRASAISVVRVAAAYQIAIEDIEKLFLASPVARINWASHVILLNSSLPLGVEYWYMKQSVEMGWSSNVLKMQIESKLFERQINSRKVNNFTATLPAPQSDLANYLLKDPYIFDLVGAKERADERDIEEQLVYRSRWHGCRL